MNILVVITARAGSKRIPNKNKKLLGGKPLIMWTIEISKKIKKIQDILVSTDDIEIAEMSKQNNLLVPWLRPSHLSGDDAKSVDVVLHAVHWYEKNVKKIEGILLLQPTSPFRDLSKIQTAINLFYRNNMKPLVSVSRAKSNLDNCFFLENKKLKKFSKNKSTFNNLYELNGSLFLVSTFHLKKCNSFFSQDMIPLILNEEEEILDIDTMYDWELAEIYLKRIKDEKNL